VSGPSTRRGLAVAALVAVVLVAPAGVAAAHPLGNFTTNTYAGLVVSADTVGVDYVLDLAEVPAFQVIDRLGREEDGQVSDRAARRYEAEQCRDIAAGVELDVDGAPALLRVAATDLSFPPGQAGLDTLRLECRLVAATGALDGERTVTLVDGNFPRRLGWREVTATGDGATLSATDVPARTISDRLRSYPEDLLQSPLDRREANVVARPGGAPGVGVLPADPGASVVGGLERLATSFTTLVATQELTAAFALAATGMAVVLGALHAVAPGHGKTVIAAYLVGSRGTSRQALGLGLTVAVTHTAGVFALGVLLSASQTVAPERLYPYLGLASGLLFSGVGALLLRRALHARRHGHGHDHGHGHGHDHGHGQDHGHAHGDALRAPAGSAPLGWRSLLAPGLAGGLVPSPSALVVLLGGIALGRAWFGVTLVVAYGIGMAATLVGAGYLLLRARTRFEARPSTGLLLRAWTVLPVATAGLIVAGGLVIAARSVMSI